MIERRALGPYALIGQRFQKGHNRRLFGIAKACACKVWINVSGREVSGPAVEIHQLCQGSLTAVGEERRGQFDIAQPRCFNRTVDAYSGARWNFCPSKLAGSCELGH